MKENLDLVLAFVITERLKTPSFREGMSIWLF